MSRFAAAMFLVGVAVGVVVMAPTFSDADEWLLAYEFWNEEPLSLGYAMGWCFAQYEHNATLEIDSCLLEHLPGLEPLAQPQDNQAEAATTELDASERAE